MPLRSHVPQLLLPNICLAFGYFALGYLAKILAIPPGNVTAFWPASGLALFFVLIWGYHCWPGIFLGNVAANLPAFWDATTTEKLISSLFSGFSIGVGDCLQTLTAAYLIGIYLSPKFSGFRQIKDVLVFLGIILITHTFSPIFGVSGLYLGGFLDIDAYLYTWITWYTGDALGCIFVVMLTLDFAKYGVGSYFKKPGAMLFIAILALLTWYLISVDRSLFFLIYLFPLTVFYTLTYQSPFVSLLNCSLVGVSMLALSQGEVVNQEFNYKLIALESFMLVLFLINATIQAFLKEKELLQKELDEVTLFSAQQSKLASIGEMAAGVAHEINNPLGIISGHAGILLRTINRDHDIRDVEQRLTKIKDTVFRIGKIVKGLESLSYSSAESQIEEFSLRQILDDILSISSGKLNFQKIVLTIECEDDSQVIGHRVQISQVFLNIITNAIDALEGQPDEERWIKIKCNRSVSYLMISISNGGPKLDPKMAERIFEPFYSTKEKSKGSGIGLSIARRIISEHDGKLYLDTLSKNTDFTLELPKS